MALIVTLSVFNGFSDLVATLFTAFAPQLEVTPIEGKTAPADDPVLTEIRQLPQVEVATECVEDMALVTYHDRQAMVTVKGVDDNFDRHGTRNERMLAHYLLGCVLSDLGDSPEALQAFYDAIEMADTTRTDYSSEVYVTQHFSCSDCKKSLPNLDYVHRKKRLTQKNWDDSHPSELTAKNRPNLLVINPL